MEKEIKSIIQEQLGIFSKIDNKDNLRWDLGMDSLDKVELMMYLDEEFLIEITEEISDKIETVQDIIDTIERLKNE